jgi:hypothetical protein
MKNIIFLLKIIFTSIFITCGTGCSENIPAQKKWTTRVIPLPKEISIIKTSEIPPDKIQLISSGSKSLAALKAEKILKKIARFKEGTPDLKIRMQLVKKTSPELTEYGVNKLFTVRNMEQAYAVAAEPAEKQLLIFAVKPVGLLYAARTLLQLAGPIGSFGSEEIITFPYVNILDWPDMEGRGFWGAPLNNIPLLARWKFNVVESFGGQGCDEKGKLDAGLDEKLIRLASSEGVKLTPYITHLGRSGKYILYRAKNNPKIKKMYEDAFGPEVNHGFFGSHQGFCMSSDLTQKIFTEWLRRMAEKNHKYHNELKVLFSEGVKKCHCSKCEGFNPFLLELKCISRAFDKVRKEYPKMRLWLYLSQGSAGYKDSNSKIIAALPEEVGLVYYHGQKTYLTDYRPMIPENLKDFARQGGRLGVVPSIGANIRTYVPFTCPQLTIFRIKEFVDKQLDSMSLFVPPSIYFYEFNIMAAAEWSWNSKGRTIEEFAEAYAVWKGIENTGLFAEWATKIGKVNYDVAEQPNGEGKNMQTHLLSSRLSDKNYYFGDIKKGRLNERKTLVENLKMAEAAFTIAGKMNNRLMVHESEYTLNMLRGYSLLDNISRSLTDEKVKPDPKQLSQWADELDVAAEAIRRNVLAWWNALVKDEQVKITYARPPRNTDYPFIAPRCRNMTYSLLRACDDVRKILSEYGIADPRKSMRNKNIGAWDINDFKKGYVEKLINITNQVTEEGGTYNVVFDFGEGYPVKIESVELHTKNMADSRLSACFISPDEMTTLRAAGRHKHVEHRIKVPVFNKGTEFFIKVKLCVGIKGLINNFPENVPEKRRICSGFIGIRRIIDL